MHGLVKISIRFPDPEVVEAFGFSWAVAAMRLYRAMLRHGLHHEFVVVFGLLPPAADSDPKDKE